MVMTVSIKTAREVTVRRFARAAVVVAFLSTPGAALGAGPAMPANCQQNLDQCSQKIWDHNSFPHPGVRQSVTFSNGATLTCTSVGPNIPRSCTLSEGRAKAAPAHERHAKEAPDKVPAKGDSKPSGAF